MENPIKTLRQQRGLTQRELALLLDLAAMQISQYETDALKPSERILQALGGIFNIDPGELRDKLEVYYTHRKAEIREKLQI